MGEELIDLEYLPVDRTEADVSASVREYRANAEELERDCVRAMLSERDVAIRLDRDLEPSVARFFELIYARIYRPTSHVAHYGMGAAVGGPLDQPADDPGALTFA